MGNCPEYFAIWLGLIQVGAIVALIGPELPAPALAHALKVAGARCLIASAECAGVCREAAAERLEPTEVWIHGRGRPDISSIDLAVRGQSGDSLDRGELRRVTLDDRALRIFTSGTTGLPKAAEVSHRKLVTWVHWFADLAGLTAADRLYNCLPMHHSVGGVVAVGAPLVKGGSVVIAERFSARSFWRDIERWECTAFQYIGELCRYLLAAPVGPADRSHGARLAIGNGLSPEVWQPFLDRFGPLRIFEFYASTEGNVWLYNVEGEIGSIGRIPPFLALRDTIALARFDYDLQAPLRGADGFCERCPDGEIGEALGRIDRNSSARFEGYSEDAETERKILRDVFKAGDAWMRTGDLMCRGADGFYRFVDRVGDTFRWKGENVSTTAVASVLCGCPGVQDAVVYGVAVPGADGRAGMALLKIGDGFDLDGLPTRLQILPKYARPLFLRIASAIATTATFKPKRRSYLEQGFDPAQIDDALYVFDSKRELYVALDAQQHASIRAQTMSF
jgi:fatty-acyl-CoA synthase